MGLINKLFTFTNGPGNLIDATQVNADFDALYTLLSGAPSGGTQGQLSKENMAAGFAKDNVEPAFSTYRTLVERKAITAAAVSAGTYYLIDGATISTPSLPYAPTVFYFDPADWVAGSRTTKLRVQASVTPNTVNPGTNWTFGLYPVGTIGGLSSAQPTVATVGSVIAGSTVAINTPTTQIAGNSGDFTAPAAGFYLFGVVNSGNAAAGSMQAVRAALQVRQV